MHYRALVEAHWRCCFLSRPAGISSERTLGKLLRQLPFVWTLVCKVLGCALTTWTGH